MARETDREVETDSKAEAATHGKLQLCVRVI